MGIQIGTRERGNFERKEGLAQDIPGDVRRSIYLKRLNRWQHLYYANADRVY